MVRYPYDIVVKWLWMTEMQPKTIFDIGVGDGLFGMLVRNALEHTNGRWRQKDRQVILAGCDIYAPYVFEQPHLHKIYDDVVVGDIAKLIRSPNFGYYDLIHAGDVIEHLPKKRAQRVLEEIPRHCNNFILSIPIGQEWLRYKHVSEENIFEDHQSAWSESEFRGYKKGARAKGSMGQVNTYWWEYCSDKKSI